MCVAFCSSHFASACSLVRPFHAPCNVSLPKLNSIYFRKEHGPEIVVYKVDIVFIQLFEVFTSSNNDCQRAIISGNAPFSG